MEKHKDMEIINHLKENAVYTLRHLSKLTGIPQSTVHDRITSLKLRGIIRKFTVLPDYHRLGFSCHSFLLAVSYDINRELLFEYLQRHPSINAVYTTAGDEFLMEVFFKTSLELAHFKDELERKRNLEIKSIIPIHGTVKKEGLKIV